jgi:uncharacterized protein YecE (DUF72 family)
MAHANVSLCLHDWREQPVTGPLTAYFVYVRRHGTRRRYGGSYTDAMLRADARRIDEWTRAGRDAYVYFSNDGRAAAVRNARRLIELLRRPRAVGPPEGRFPPAGPAPAAPQPRESKGL